MSTGINSEIFEKLKIKNMGKVVIMPDFFIDRFVIMESIGCFRNILAKKLNSGGGSLSGYNQYESKGGNATNTAYSLGKLGVNVRLITVSEGVFSNILHDTFSNLPNVLVRVVKGRPGQTVALEFKNGRKNTNIMLSDLGDISVFDVDRLNNEDWESITKAGMVCIMNWAANYKGTDLALRVFNYAKQHKVKTFFAPADMSVRIDDFKDFLKQAFDKELITILSINENELRFIEKILKLESMPRYYSSSNIMMSAKKVSDLLSTRVDIHTAIGSSTAYNGSASYSPSFNVNQNFATGAGDVWDAADIAAYLTGIDSNQRLFFANACAGYYISNLQPEPPTLNEIMNFLIQKPSQVEYH